MLSPFPKLDNRTIDQWKVTELKEELKRRKLTTKGLKDDLIKRLDEAIQVERAEALKLEREDAERIEREDAERIERENAEKLERENAEKLARENAENLARENAEEADNGTNIDLESEDGGNDVEPHVVDVETEDTNAAATDQGNADEDYVIVDKHDSGSFGEDVVVQSTTAETTVENLKPMLRSLRVWLNTPIWVDKGLRTLME